MVTFSYGNIPDSKSRRKLSLLFICCATIAAQFFYNTPRNDNDMGTTSPSVKYSTTQENQKITKTKLKAPSRKKIKKSKNQKIQKSKK